MYVLFAIIELDQLYKKGAFKPDSIRFSHRRSHKKYKDSHHKLHSGKRADQVTYKFGLKFFNNDFCLVTRNYYKQYKSLPL